MPSSAAFSLTLHYPPVLPSSVSSSSSATAEDPEIANCVSVYKTIAERIVSYTCMLLMDSGTFPDANRRHSLAELTRLLESDPRLARGLPPSFLPAVLTGITEQEGIQEVFQPMINDIFGGLARAPVSSSHEHTSAVEATLEVATRKMSLLVQLCRYPAVVPLITEHKTFLPLPTMMPVRMVGTHIALHRVALMS